MLIQQAVTPLVTDSARAALLHARALQDSARLTALSGHIDSQYVNYLEKTQAQMSIWWTVVGVLLGAVAVSVAVGTVVAAVLMYRQSKEFREMQKSAATDYKVVLDAVVAEYTSALGRLMDSSDEKLNTALEGQQAQLELALKAATGEQIALVEQKLRELALTREEVSAHLKRSDRNSRSEAVTGAVGMLNLQEKVRQHIRVTDGIMEIIRTTSAATDSYLAANRAVMESRYPNLLSLLDLETLRRTTEGSDDGPMSPPVSDPTPD